MKTEFIQHLENLQARHHKQVTVDISWLLSILKNDQHNAPIKPTPVNVDLDGGKFR